MELQIKNWFIKNQEKKPLVKMPILVEEWIRMLRVFAAGFVIHSRS